MKLKMSMIDAKNFTPLAENEYDEDIFRNDEGGYFQTHIYFRNSKKNFYLPAFSFEDISDSGYYLEFGKNKDGSERKKFQQLQNNLYCDTSEKAPLGLSVAGWTYIFILKDGKIFETHKLLILPDLPNKAECAAMISELLFIRRELFQKIDENNSTLAENLRERSWDEILKYLNEQAAEIFRLMKKINERPRFALKKVLQSCDVSKIRRFNNKIFSQYFISPDRKKYQVCVDKISMNIFENRLLKNKLFRLKNFIETQALQQKINAESLQKDLETQTEYIEKLKIRNEKDKIFAKNNIKSLELQFQHNEKFLNLSSNKILESLNACLKLPFFSEVEIKDENWRMTQIFTNDENYRRAYQQLKNFDEILDFSFYADENSLSSEKMYQIYEWWTLAKIIEFLVVKLNWKSDNAAPLEILRKVFNNLENIQSARISLTHEISKMKMEIFYNTEINESLQTSGCNLRPDFLFKVTAGDIEKIFILDAKYRNYKHQGFKYWLEKDLYGVCFEKYIQKIETDTGKKISMSFIVHSDKTADPRKFLGKYVVYNGTLLFENFAELKGAVRQIGSFYLLPQFKNDFNQSEINLSLFFKMMFEYFMDQWEICWECGSKVKKEILTTFGGRPKYYMHCKNCGAFWVKSHCGNCTNKLLIKHAINYHMEEINGKPWYVLCPACKK